MECDKCKTELEIYADISSHDSKRIQGELYCEDCDETKVAFLGKEDFMD